MRFTTLFLVLLLMAPAALGVDFSGSEVFIPIVSHAEGRNDTEWRTDLVISSREASRTTEVAMIFKPAGPGEAVQARATLAPLETVTFHDFVGTRLGLRSVFGTLWIGTADDTARISAHARIYNVGNAAGEFGQVVQGMPIDQLPRESWLHGLTGVNGNRTNVGIANPNNEPAVFSMSWYDSSGESHGSVSLGVDPWQVFLLNDIFDKTGVAPAEGLTLRFRSNVPIYAYGSVVRNDTGDAYTIVGSGPD